MKVHGYKIDDEVIESAMALVKGKWGNCFGKSQLEGILIDLQIPRVVYHDGGGYSFIASDSASRIIQLWKKQELVNPITSNRGGYWEWRKKGSRIIKFSKRTYRRGKNNRRLK